MRTIVAAALLAALTLPASAPAFDAAAALPGLPTSTGTTAEVVGGAVCRATVTVDNTSWEWPILGADGTVQCTDSVARIRQDTQWTGDFVPELHTGPTVAEFDRASFWTRRVGRSAGTHVRYCAYVTPFGSTTETAVCARTAAPVATYRMT